MIILCIYPVSKISLSRLKLYPISPNISVTIYILIWLLVLKMNWIKAALIYGKTAQYRLNVKLGLLDYISRTRSRLGTRYMMWPNIKIYFIYLY